MRETEGLTSQSRDVDCLNIYIDFLQLCKIIQTAVGGLAMRP